MTGEQGAVERNVVWLIWASQGEYSDRSEWPVAVTMDQATGETVTERLGQLWRELYQIYKRREDELDEAGDWGGETLFATTPEGIEYTRLTGHPDNLGSVYADDRTFTCCEVRVLSAIDAALKSPAP